MWATAVSLETAKGDVCHPAGCGDKAGGGTGEAAVLQPLTLPALLLEKKKAHRLVL